MVAAAVAAVAGILAFFAITPDTLGEMAGVDGKEITRISVVGEDGQEVIYETEDAEKIKEFLAYMEDIAVDLSGFSEPDDKDGDGRPQYTVRFHDGLMTVSYFIFSDSERVFYGGRVYQAEEGSFEEMKVLAAGW